MIEALRGLGYSVATALSDIVDNSIAARARTVDVNFTWDGDNSSVAIMDDGEGMDASELDMAMRLGEINPLARRASHDLGRFGIGLKTASFSQCRRLTVASRKLKSTSCLRWDLDEMAGHPGDGWLLFEGPARGSEALIACVEEYSHGTVVLWEKLDRIVTSGVREQEFLDVVDRVEQHLSLVFHRFMSGRKPRLAIRINGRAILPRDPFLSAHPATWSSPVARLKAGGANVEVQCYVLPHKDRIAPRDYETAAGPDGWTAQQGFHVYRGERLLVAGSWLGLGRGRSWTKEESHRLARIRLDIPNNVDAEWKIDIRKSVARPPVSMREELTRLAEDTRERARRVFAHRGTPATRTAGGVLAQAWRVEQSAQGVRYRLDTDHPAVAAVLHECGAMKPLVTAMLRVIEETVPVQRIWLDTTEAKETPRTGFGGQPAEEVNAVLLVMYRSLIGRSGLSPQLARQRLLSTEPFNLHPELVEALPDGALGEET